MFPLQISDLPPIWEGILKRGMAHGILDTLKIPSCDLRAPFSAFPYWQAPRTSDIPPQVRRSFER
jgi:hypothetical protein